MEDNLRDYIEKLQGKGGSIQLDEGEQHHQTVVFVGHFKWG